MIEATGSTGGGWPKRCAAHHSASTGPYLHVTEIWNGVAFGLLQLNM